MNKKIKSSDGLNICYKYIKGKKKKTLIFLHGVGANWTVWKNEISFFRKRGYSIIAPDLRGHGLSDAPKEFEMYQITCFSQDIFDIIKKEKIKNFSLIGHSLGGGIGINFCMLHGKTLPDEMVLIETSSVYPFEHEHLLNLSPYLTHFLRFVASHEKTKEENFPHLKDIDLSLKGVKEDLHIISQILHLTSLRSIVKTLDNLEEYTFKNQSRINKTLKNLKIPLLIVAGDCDNVVPPKFSYIIKKLNKDSKLLLMKNAGHRVIINKPEKVSKVVYDFIEKN